MSAHLCNAQSVHVPHPKGGHFHPRGPLSIHGRKRNPADELTGTQTLASRLIVGFNVGDKAKYSIDDLIPIVERVRNQQGHGAGASFVAQRGIYQRSAGGKLVEEDSAQVIVFNDAGATLETFTKEMIALGETICKELEQDMAFMDIQDKGIVLKSFVVTP
jgi:hypothetical protein